MSLVVSFKAALRVRRYDGKFYNPKFKPRFKPRPRRFPKPKRWLEHGIEMSKINWLFLLLGRIQFSIIPSSNYYKLSERNTHVQK